MNKSDQILFFTRIETVVFNPYGLENVNLESVIVYKNGKKNVNVLYHGHHFRIFSTSADRILWRCRERSKNCKASLYSNRLLQDFTPRILEHNHPLPKTKELKNVKEVNVPMFHYDKFDFTPDD